MDGEFYVSIDFDGTIVEKDITDVVIQRFAAPGWEEAEKEWEKGIIGSRECLTRQISLVSAPLPEILDFLDGFTVDETFPDFVKFLRFNRIPHAVISDGFSLFSRRILSNAGMPDLAVYANGLTEAAGKLCPLFPYSKEGCASGTCKCSVAAEAGSGRPVILIGDGRSDFGLAEKAAFVFSKGKLTKFCREKGIPHVPIRDFGEAEKYLRIYAKTCKALKPTEYKDA